MSICYLLDGEMPPARQNGKSLPCVRLQAENDSLRKELAVNEPLFETLNAANDGLIAENDKLRELVKDMWQFTGAACKKYPRLFDQSAQGGQMVMPNMLDSFEHRMRELGVEV